MTAAPHIARRIPASQNPDEVVKRLRWAFAVSGLSFEKFTPDGTRIHGPQAWSYLLEEVLRQGWALRVWERDPPVQVHLKGALTALEADDRMAAYLHIRRLVTGAAPDDAEAKALHLFTPVFKSVFDVPDADLERAGRRLRLSGTGTVLGPNGETKE